MDRSTVRAGGAEPFLYLEYSLPGAMSGCGKEAQPDINAGPPKNATLWGVAAAAFLKLARTADPGLKLAHLTNEPNSNWFKREQPDRFLRKFICLTDPAARHRQRPHELGLRILLCGGCRPNHARGSGHGARRPCAVLAAG